MCRLEMTACMPRVWGDLLSSGLVHKESLLPRQLGRATVSTDSCIPSAQLRGDMAYHALPRRTQQTVVTLEVNHFLCSNVFKC